MQRQRPGALLDHGPEYADAVPTGGVRDELARSEGTGGCQSSDKSGQGVVGYGEKYEFAARYHSVRRQERHAGEQVRRPAAAGLGHPRGGDHRMTGGCQRRTEHAADATGADDADRQAWPGASCVHLEAFQSLAGYRTTALSVRQVANRPDRAHSYPVGAWGARWRAGSPYLLAGLLAVSGTTHFAAPASYAAIIPRVLPGRTFLVYVSGLAELACAAGLLPPVTRRRAAWVTAALFVVVFPANLQMALDAGGRSSTYQALVWLRLPLQLPLLAWAVGVARRCAQRA